MNRQQPGERRMKILLVDDTPENLVSLEAALSGLDEDLVMAQSGKEALRHLLNDDFAAILLDVRMPEMDGFETAEMIRSRPRSRQTPILFLTGYRNEEHLFRGYDLGAVDFLFKPIVPEVLRSKVAVFVELSRANARLRQQTEALRKQAEELQRAEQEVRRLNAGLEARVLERTEELLRSNEELQQFAYVASHDLREPLRTVSIYAQLLAKRYAGKLEGDGHQFIAFIVENAARMETLVHDLLDFSRIDVRGMDFFARTSLETAMDDAIGNIRTLVAESGAVITRDPLPTVMGDAVQLTRLFQNLLVNSIKYRNQEVPRVHVAVRESGDDYLISVKDNGIGIDPQYAEKIFGIFRVLQPRDRNSGSGMGLAICRKIVSRHAGRIWVDSALGKGATFYWTVPRKD
ncbi:MAG TPA: ATP-binding protein [Bryobacteraceae bacterium]|nr:ATP-binding protein [Bryobacteraceae bacterium]